MSPPDAGGIPLQRSQPLGSAGTTSGRGCGRRQVDPSGAGPPGAGGRSRRRADGAVRGEPPDPAARGALHRRRPGRGDRCEPRSSTRRLRSRAAPLHPRHPTRGARSLQMATRNCSGSPPARAPRCSRGARSGARNSSSATRPPRTPSPPRSSRGGSRGRSSGSSGIWDGWPRTAGPSTRRSARRWNGPSTIGGRRCSGTAPSRPSSRSPSVGGRRRAPCSPSSYRSGGGSSGRDAIDPGPSPSRRSPPSATRTTRRS